MRIGKIPALAALLGAALGASSAFPASAAVLFACGEDSCMTPIQASGTSVTPVTTAGAYRAGWAREGLSVWGNTSADPNPQRWISPVFTATSNLWVHAEFYLGGMSSATTNQQALLIRSPDGVARILLRLTSAPGQIKVSTRNAAGTITDIGSPSSSNFGSGLNTLDINVNYTCTAAGGVTVYLNGASVIAFTGNPCTDSATSLDQVEFSDMASSTVQPCTSASGATCWSEIVVANSSTLGYGLLSLTPTASGATQNWVPNTLANINKTANNDTTSITTTGNNVLSEWTQATAIPSGNFGVVAITQDFRIEKGATGPQNALPLVHVGASDFTGTSFSPLTSFSNWNYVWATNPATGLAWTTTDVTAPLQYGVESAP